MNNEKYMIREDNKPFIKFQDFYELVLTKHKSSYGEKSSHIIKNNVNNIFKKIHNMNSQNRNLLVVGKVQSGKTSNLELLTALLFDNDYQIGIIYGGYDNKLLEQTVSRFKKTFLEMTERGKLIIINSLGDSIDGLRKDDFLKRQIEQGTKVLFITLKKAKGIDKVANQFLGVGIKDKSSFIIDDEGDQASLNTEFKKRKESSTYKSITNMISFLKKPVYISTTATPYAIVFQPYFSLIKPHDVCLVEPGVDYNGANFFHLDDKHIIVLNGKNNYELRDAIIHFLISTAILSIEHSGIKTNMVIHIAKEISKHNETEEEVRYIMSELSDLSQKYPGIFRDVIMEKFKDSFFNQEILDKYDIDFVIKSLKNEVLKNTFIIMQHGQGKDSQTMINSKRFKINIGGELLQRGVTFDNLVTTYFTRWAKKGNIDTTLQRARWFGYRRKIENVMKVFMPIEIKQEFSNLTELENDVWAQFDDVQNDNSQLQDIIIDLTDTNLQPSRKNVIDVENYSYKKKWYNQKTGFFDKTIVDKNNEIISSFISKCKFTNISLGRTDDKENVRLSTINLDAIKLLIKDLKCGILSLSPFTSIEFDKVLEKQDNIDVILMFLDDKSTRSRSFVEGKISALQQGADTMNDERQKYKGDAHVINNPDRLTMQIFNVLPEEEGTPKDEYQQFMLSIYIPAKGRYMKGRI